MKKPWMYWGTIVAWSFALLSVVGAIRLKTPALNTIDWAVLSFVGLVSITIIVSNFIGLANRGKR